jgi:hypothetical protein
VRNGGGEYRAVTKTVKEALWSNGASSLSRAFGRMHHSFVKVRLDILLAMGMLSKIQPGNQGLPDTLLR